MTQFGDLASCHQNSAVNGINYISLVICWLVRLLLSLYTKCTKQHHQYSKSYSSVLLTYTIFCAGTICSQEICSNIAYVHNA